MRHIAQITVLVVLSLLSTAASARDSLSVPTPSGEITVERIGDCSQALCPAVMILSGSRGFGAPVYDEIGQTFRTAGLNTYLVHVLNPTDLDVIANTSGASTRIAYYADRLEGWISDVDAVAAYLKEQPQHGGRVGLLGISLGAQIASAASVSRTDIDALVLVDGGFPSGYSRHVDILPPLLLIWGSDDHTFPLSVGMALEGIAQQIGVPVTLDVYEGGAHDFFLRSGTENASAAHQSAANYLLRWLQ
ncbi:dienelactone hydrolase family protein (plasmid) [Devosia sp. A8/3-2]|nr:dienelactone hydrolase family protein [Devosia sp. A8/3-2]